MIYIQIYFKINISPKKRIDQLLEHYFFFFKYLKYWNFVEAKKQYQPPTNSYQPSFTVRIPRTNSIHSLYIAKQNTSKKPNRK